MNDTYVVTGGAGFIGTNLVERLVADGHRVVVIDDLSAGKRERLPDGVEFHTLDVRNAEALVPLFAGARTVFHLAALPRVQYSIEHPRETFDINVTGTLAVLEAARTAAVQRVVFASTSAVYGDNEQLPLSESLPAAPKSPYALHKQIGEGLMRLYAELYGIETVSLRFFNVYGPHLDPDGAYALVIGRFLKLAQEGKPLTITGDGEQTRDFVHVRDVVAALRSASETDRVGNGETINIGTGASVSVNTLAQLFGGSIEYVAPRIEPRHTRADITCARALLLWEPTVDLPAGIGELKRQYGLA